MASINYAKFDPRLRQPAWKPVPSTIQSGGPWKPVSRAPAAQPHVTPTQESAPAPAAGQPPVAPFLTPAQQKQYIADSTAYQNSRAALTRRISDAIANTATGLQNAHHAHDVSTNMENQTAAARGLFQSSIRAGDLNDIDATLTMRTNTLNTALNTLTLTTQGQIGTLDTGWGVTQGNYDTQAVQNAQGVPPTTGPATPAPQATTPGQVSPVNPTAAPVHLGTLVPQGAASGPANPPVKLPTGKVSAPKQAKPPGSKGSKGGQSWVPVTPSTALHTLHLVAPPGMGA